MTFKPRFCIDQDQVLADLLSEWLSRYNYDYSDNLKSSDINKWNWHDLTKAGQKIYSYLDDPEIFENLPVIADSQEVTLELSKHFELFVVTAPWNPESIVSKSRWLQKHFPHISKKNHVFVQNKGIIRTDYLLDDKAANFTNLDNLAVGILYDAPHNQDETDYARVKSWQDVREWYLG